ncbi:Glycosyl transferase family 2 [Flexibacter flexilis DSM 6793]|uniref:Glycosyl transferase family 2 n=1 Tax=Flexibacter flexilis DSM 6793 TaxID=927664 RepID=A0A1I1G0W0_9BACT|nr:glycosyltransferase [Flexibacter flexilis]SFC05141.1 Glycosyl transferase family 2 [Flexibacter flexilis DSM 6793]
MNKPFTLVSTVFNEINRLDQTIADIEAQTLPPTQIIITDAGSTDGTYERLMRWKTESKIEIVVLVKERCNVAEGRNMAIQAAKYDLIASTDFGCRFLPKWLESIMTPFEDEKIRIVAGSYKVREEYVDTLAAKADWVLANAYQIQMDQYFVPSSRSIAYYREIWESVGGYPEWVTLAADDSTFAYLIFKKGIKMHYVDEPNVYWLRHKTFTGFKKECWRYGLGEGETQVGMRNFLSNLVETSCRYTLPIGIMLLISGLLPLWFILPVVAVQTFGLRSYKNAFKNWWRLRSDKYNFQVFLASLYLTEISRLTHMKGYIQGYWYSPEFRKQEAKKLQAILNA